MKEKYRMQNKLGKEKVKRESRCYDAQIKLMNSPNGSMEDETKNHG